jgi:hypothetical protein
MPSPHVYVALLGEGTDVWRPVSARDLGGGMFEILGIVPAGETWQFPPGAKVRCVAHRFSDGKEGVRAVAQLSS